MRNWCERKGLDVPTKFWEDPSAQYNFKDSDSLNETVRQKQNHQQLYLILYLEYLLISVCQRLSTWYTLQTRSSRWDDEQE